MLAMNRFVAIVFPLKLEVWLDTRRTYIIIGCCIIFGGFNCVICLSGAVQSLWDPLFPTFYFTNQTNFVAVFMRSVDLYFSELVVCSSLVIYLVIVAYLILKIHQTSIPVLSGEV
ncbi:hypothetical protein OESDEN_08301 [Oesophagostomum dentatum]|uniref:7TM GPCR serpentine receptor class x (Srx) domain-containing protein n=1 Tax=Oesophagostomum dentatum TaxID=61180 RepID=A0A0B1T6Q7_OESDE|nr:hypothetical protein OESDEN_08301 [Oesophagostomum dentatum]